MGSMRRFFMDDLLRLTVFFQDLIDAKFLLTHNPNLIYNHLDRRIMNYSFFSFSPFFFPFSHSSERVYIITLQIPLLLPQLRTGSLLIMIKSISKIHEFHCYLHQKKQISSFHCFSLNSRLIYFRSFPSLSIIDTLLHAFD